eukprot:TRINITY_DN3486_c0_g1_i1.p1 TRINITY_DN3486_c0_g1~~TRINITY_DN3486_c0_g1_i1.p1  ORF type:complete len:1082 (-),score=346.13 TRINITY_DN3486_c0_g1_i1:4034-7279(-)
MADQEVASETKHEAKLDSRDILQTKAFTAWANSHLSQKQKNIQNMVEDLKDGLLFISLVEVLESRDFPEKYEKSANRRVERLSNAQAFLKHLDKNRIQLVGVNPDAIVDGNPKMLLATLWALIRRFHIQIDSHEGKSGDGPAPENNMSRLKKELLEWVQQQVAPYEDVQVSNFTTSFKDGKAFCALVDSLEPGVMSYPELGADVAGNLEKAFSIAEANLSIPRLLHPSDIADGFIDEQSIMTYVSYFRNAKLTLSKKRLLEGQLDQERNSKEKLTKTIDDQAARIKELEEELARLKEEYNQYKSSTEQEKQELEQKLGERDSRITALEQELDNLRKSGAEKQEQDTLSISNLTQEIETLRKSASEKQEQDAEVISVLTKEVETLKEQTSQAAAQIASLEQAHQNLAQEKTSLAETVEKTAAQLSQVQEKKEATDTEVSLLQEKVSTVTKDLSEKVEQLSANLEQSRTSNNELQSKLEKSETESKDLEEKFQAARSEWTKKEEQMTSRISSVEESNASQVAQIAQLKDSIEALQKEKTELADTTSNEIAALKAELQRLKEEYAKEHEARQILEGFKKFVIGTIAPLNMDGLLQDPQEITRTKEQIKTYAHAIEVEKLGIPKMEEKIAKYHMELSNFDGALGTKEVEKMQELEIMIQQYKVEIAKRYRNQAIASADHWLAKMTKLRLESTSTFSVGVNIESRLQELHAQLEESNRVMMDMRHTFARLDKDYDDKSKENDGVYQLMKGSSLLKYKNGGKGVPHRRKFFLHLFDTATLFWSLGDVSQKDAGFFQSTDYRQAAITDVKGGPSKQVRDSQNLTSDVEELSFTIYTSTRVLDLIAPDHETYELWTTVLLRVVENFRKGFIGASKNARINAERILKEDLEANFDPEIARNALAEEEKKKEIEKQQALEQMTSAIRRRSSIIPSGLFSSISKDSTGEEGSSASTRRGSVLDQTKTLTGTTVLLKETVLEEDEAELEANATPTGNKAAEETQGDEQDDELGPAPLIEIENDDDDADASANADAANPANPTTPSSTSATDAAGEEETVAPLSTTTTSGDSAKKDAGRRKSFFGSMNPFGSKS